MRLWHKEMISILPRQQLVSQWRECVLIAKNISESGKPNHLLVNPIIDYPLEHFVEYCYLVASEMKHRGYKISLESYEKLNKYLKSRVDLNKSIIPLEKLFEKWHDDAYFNICYYNILEKYRCKGISEKEYLPIKELYLRRTANLIRNSLERIKK